MYCQKCGSKCKENISFCSNCGNQLYNISKNEKNNGIGSPKKYFIFGGIIIGVIIIFILGSLNQEQRSPEETIKIFLEGWNNGEVGIVKDCVTTRFIENTYDSTGYYSLEETVRVFPNSKKKFSQIQISNQMINGDSGTLDVTYAFDYISPTGEANTRKNERYLLKKENKKWYIDEIIA